MRRFRGHPARGGALRASICSQPQLGWSRWRCSVVACKHFLHECFQDLVDAIVRLFQVKDEVNDRLREHEEEISGEAKEMAPEKEISENEEQAAESETRKASTVPAVTAEEKKKSGERDQEKSTKGGDN